MQRKVGSAARALHPETPFYTVLLFLGSGEAWEFEGECWYIGIIPMYPTSHLPLFTLKATLLPV